MPIGKESFYQGVHMPRQSAHVALLTESSECAIVQLLDIFIYNIFLRHLLIKKIKQKAEGAKKIKEKKKPHQKREKRRKKEQEKKESEKNNLEVLASFECLCRALLLLS